MECYVILFAAIACTYQVSLMAAFKIVIAERIVITAFKVARTVAFRLIALCGIGSISGSNFSCGRKMTDG